MNTDLEKLTDLSEKGAVKEGKQTKLDRRLFLQLIVFDGCRSLEKITACLEKSSADAVVYKDVNNPLGIGVLTMHEDPLFFVNELRDIFLSDPFQEMQILHEYTMFGRTYSLGHEQELEDWLIHRPKRVLQDATNTWAIWYPLRRKGSFELLSTEEHRNILMEHGMIGHAFGKAGLGKDIRLTCTGLDKNDNDFIIGLIGEKMYPLSALVQAMRKTKQTSTFIDKMGPFFVGHFFWSNH